LTTQIYRGRVKPEQARTFAYVPFDVVSGTTRIDISCRYSDRVGSEPWLTHGNTVDLGLLDTRGTQFGNMGFRGWTGSVRDEIYVAEYDATPGYLCGNIEAGTWYVMLGFYKIAPQGCEYEVSVTLSQEHKTLPQQISGLLDLAGQPSRALRRADGWYRGELHCHTEHSDGDSSVDAVIRAAQELGLDFLAIMDHNNVSHHQAMLHHQQKFAPPITLIPGCEITTYWGHWNAWGLADWVEFRTPTQELMQGAMQEARRRGALVSCNHPRTYGPSWEFLAVSEYSCIEVWNGPWPLFNWEAQTFWENQLRQGRRLVAVGGSDMHRLKPTGEAVAQLGTPTTWIYCPGVPTAAALLNALSAGNCFISESPAGPRLYLCINDVWMGGQTPQSDDAFVQIRVSGGKGSELVLHGTSGTRYSCLIDRNDIWLDIHMDCSDERYLWAQLRDPGTTDNQPIVHAMTNPVYFVAAP
jgi:hypothetical protein